jgi:lycopene cyclase domain-containing protein
MTYFGFLLVFLVLPALVMLGIQWRTGRNDKVLWAAVGAQIALALLYTTPWDNYLVAAGVWYYNPKLVTGMLLGYVPIEEYTFFVLETLLVGLWWWFQSRQLRPQAGFRPSRAVRVWSVGLLAALWMAIAALFVNGWKPGTYLLITLVWALPPIILQMAFGADILWHERRLLAAVILPAGIYLCAADALAIRVGIWAIDPAQSTGMFIGALPIEEAVFFFVTVVLITFGLTLTMSEESRARLPLRSPKGYKLQLGINKE